MLRRLLCFLGVHKKPDNSVGHWCPHCRKFVWAREVRRG